MVASSPWLIVLIIARFRGNKQVIFSKFLLGRSSRVVLGLSTKFSRTSGHATGADDGILVISYEQRINRFAVRFEGKANKVRRE